MTAWNQFVLSNEETNRYAILHPVDRIYFDVTMVKENGQWKLLKTNADRPLISGYDSAVLEDPDAAATVKKLAVPRKAQVEQAIARNQELLNQEYATYDEAVAALEAIDVTQGTYFALVP